MADTLIGGININEILSDPNSAMSAAGAPFETDCNGTDTPMGEFIEILKTSNTVINISGLQLWDQMLGNRFTFPPGTVVQPSVMPW